MKIPIVMKTWAGSESYDFLYIFKSISSILSSNLPSCVELVIYDDCSTDSRMTDFFDKVLRSDSRVRVVRNHINRGPNAGQEHAFSMVCQEYNDAPFYVNVDDDVVYHRDWFSRLSGAYNDFIADERNGIFSALNMPFRREHSIERLNGRTYLLKWKQPALNWLIPRKVYEDVGPFRDEGIAYDTAYTHWSRLKNYPIICMTPSYVQNIGLQGAYAKGSMTTSRDFLGEGGGYGKLRQFLNAIKYDISRLPSFVRDRSSCLPKIIAPIRWGNEFVFEGENINGENIAFYLLDSYLKLGWRIDEIESRFNSVKTWQIKSPLQLISINKTNNISERFIDANWKFMPNIRECKELQLNNISVGKIFKSIYASIADMHRNMIAHNKIRNDNLYFDADSSCCHLAWFGFEPYQGLININNVRSLLNSYCCAVDRWATDELKEKKAISSIQTYAPEIFDGCGANCASDVYSIGALLASYVDDDVNTIDQFKTRRQQWDQGYIPEKLGEFSPVVRKALNPSPGNRYSNVIDMAKDFFKVATV
ncbi:glycosyltransferase [Pelobacter propionicus]|uniref:Protein kinase domain-containing protein n=1 Tax=Pelobacter propionicus (strain DSM 2379 / NBRC 103807 / OttBd1) TaxID=338966 RepID=A1ARU3_PELPD|nr:glycosyltransferase [Pelobacter propionicus]ABL00064.1 hypothetical protein Ppro_2458 [Pelobacter propionicus DSM 2379]